MSSLLSAVSAQRKKLAIVSARALSPIEETELHKLYDCVLKFNPVFHSAKFLDGLVYDCLVIDISNKKTLHWFSCNSAAVNEACNTVLLLRRGEVFDADDAMQKYRCKFVTKLMPEGCKDRDAFEKHLLCVHMPSVKSRWRRFLKVILGFFCRL